MRKLLYLFLLSFWVVNIAFSEVKQPLRIMSYNIRIGIGMDNKTDLKRIADVINRVQPDFVGLQEVDSVAERSGWVNQYLELARLTNMYPVFAPATERSKGLYGIAALVRNKPVSYGYVALPGKEEPRVFLYLEYPKYTLCNTHFSLDANSRMESIEVINKTLYNNSKPIIITGDFNMEPLSSEFLKMNSSWQLLSSPLLKTYPSDHPSKRLDYIFGDKKHEYKVVNDKVIDVLSSDHLPIYIDVLFKM